MKIPEKFRIVKTRERSTSARYSDTLGLTSVTTTSECFKLEPGDFNSSGEADSMRSLKDFPDDYLIVQVW
jgi:hypothetical protein